MPSTSHLFYDYVIGLNVTTVSAAVITFLLTGYFSSPFNNIDHVGDDITKEDKTRGKRSSASKQAEPMSWATLFKSHGDTLCNLSHNTHRKILQHLSLDIDVNVQWTKIPEDVRCLVLCRLLGVDGHTTSSARAWLAAQSKSIEESDELLEDCLRDYRRKVTNVSQDSDNAFKIAGSYRDPELTSALGRKFGVVSKLKRSITSMRLTFLRE